MRLQRSALLLTAAVAIAAMAASSAFAQKASSRGSSTTSTGHAMSTSNGGYSGGRIGITNGGLLDGPGISVGPGPQFIDNKPSGNTKSRDARRRTTTPRNNNGGGTILPPSVPGEVLMETANAVTPDQIRVWQQRYRLTLVEQQTLQLTGATLMRWRIADRRSVPTLVNAFRRDGFTSQPNHLFALQESATTQSFGSVNQYELGKLHLPQAHELAKGSDVRVAVIDSGIDASSPELADSIAESFDTLSGPMKPHKHGTAIAGLIAAHGSLRGAAPDARLLAVRAFNPEGEAARGTTFNILKGVDWAASHGARVINMSFAGPNDPALHRSLEAAHKKGIVLVAAVGNAGPDSPPLYPGADPNVIGVTATDADDKLFPLSNRGDQVAIAAPGARILVVIPDGSYEVSSGTSYSAATVSGIVALMLQREPTLTPDNAREILMATAKDLGPKGRDPMFGAGLADAFAALMAEHSPMASTASAPSSPPAK